PGGGVIVRERALGEAIDLFVRAGHLEVHLPGEPAPAKRPASSSTPSKDAIYVVPPLARLSLDLSKNIVVHFFVSRAIVATALLADTPPTGEASVAVASLKERVQALSR